MIEFQQQPLEEPVLKIQDQFEEDELLNICDMNFDDFSGVFFSDLFKDNDDNNNNFATSSSESSSSPSSCVEQGSVSPSSADESSAEEEGAVWIRQIEDMLFDEDDGNKNNLQQGYSSSVEDDFFADLDFPSFQRQQQQEDGISGAPDELQSNNDQVRISIDDDDFMDVFNDVEIEETDDFGVVLDYEKPPSPQNNDNCSFAKDGTSDSSENKDISSEDKYVEVNANEKKRAHDLEEDNEEDENDDPITKKRKRQMRNRDAAVRSRERKKLYVKDLEMKSKYFEGECIRLQRLLQYCTAENHALHLQLQEKAIAASRTMQESAVLLLESLLLGSLLWFLAMVVGLISPLEMLLKQQLPARSVVVVSAGSNNQRVLALERARSKKRVGIGIS